MTTPQPGKSDKPGWSDVLAASFWGCVILVLSLTIPLLTILAGLVTLKEGLAFWGWALIVLGFLASIGPFYAAFRAKDKR